MENLRLYISLLAALAVAGLKVVYPDSPLSDADFVWLFGVLAALVYGEARTAKYRDPQTWAEVVEGIRGSVKFRAAALALVAALVRAFAPDLPVEVYQSVMALLGAVIVGRAV